ncbi:MAG: helix-turn-helix transcriptional regulator [Alphaproteobacteria bacterium]|nr:MAG: helix-turn-helix transcriptional regulator [Alphaproteobacteria bacterium]
MAKNKPDLVKWEPDLSPKAQEHIGQLRRELEPRIALMRSLRKALGLTQAEVAGLLGVTQSNVSKIEVRGDPSLSVLERIAEAKGKRLRLVVESGEGVVETSFALS